MTQLTYNEAFDPYHATFRIIRLWRACGFEDGIQFDKLRILDFYLLFPFRIQNVKLQSMDRGWRKISQSYERMSPYGRLPDDRSLFDHMEPFQRAAIGSMVKSGLLSGDDWNNHRVKFLETTVPERLEVRCLELNSEMQDVIDIIQGFDQRYELLGKDGLKDRSGLLEYRYDAV